MSNFMIVSSFSLLYISILSLDYEDFLRINDAVKKALNYIVGPISDIFLYGSSTSYGATDAMVNPQCWSNQLYKHTSTVSDGRIGKGLAKFK